MQNKFARYTVYTIVVAMAIWMGLTVVDLKDIFQPGGSHFIKVEGKEVYFNNISTDQPRPVYFKSIREVLEEYSKDKNMFRSQILKNMLENWQKPSFIRDVEFIRRHIIRVMLWQMKLELANDIGYQLSKDKFNYLQKQSFRKYKDELYNEYLDKFYRTAPKGKQDMKPQSKDDYLDERGEHAWRGFATTLLPYLETYYLLGIIDNALQQGLLVSLPEIEEDFRTENHEVKVEFALYSYDQFVQEASFKKLVKEDDLKKYYENNELKITAKKITFKTKKEAEKALKDPNLFKEEKDKKKKPKYKISSQTIRPFNNMYKLVDNYKKGDITSPIEDSNTKKFNVYQVISKEKAFQSVKESANEYQNLVEKYGKEQYGKYQKEYEKKGDEVMKGFLANAKGGASFGSLKGGFNIKTGRTDFFNQNSIDVALENTKTKENKMGKPIIEFVTIAPGGKKVFNNEFFKSSFAQKKGEISPKVLSETMMNRKLFFVVKKLDEKLPNFSKDFTADKRRKLFKQKQDNDWQMIDSLWLNYLLEYTGYSVDVNADAILLDLGLPIPPSRESSKTS